VVGVCGRKACQRGGAARKGLMQWRFYLCLNWAIILNDDRYLRMHCWRVYATRKHHLNISVALHDAAWKQRGSTAQRIPATGAICEP